MGESKENFQSKENKAVKRIKERILASPIGADARTHLYEIEYEYYNNGVVKEVPGTLRDLGPVSEEEKEKIKSEEEKENK